MTKINSFQDMYRHDFGSFVKFSFNVLNPSIQYEHNWHIDVIAHHLNLVAKGEIKRLVINLPPRMLKSHCTSVAFPAWILGRDPYKKVLCLNGGKELMHDLDHSSFMLMQNPRYRALFSHVGIQREKMTLRTAFGGHRRSMLMTSSLTGLGADIIIIDDPIDAVDVETKHLRERVQRQFDGSIVQRLNNKENSAIILVMQRLHEDDLSAHVLRQNNGWVHLDIPAIAMKDEVWDLPYDKVFSRQKGEVLHEKRMDKTDLLLTMLSLKSSVFAYQYMQGQYKLEFGDEEEGCLYLTPFRENVPIDSFRSIEEPFGWCKFHEKGLMLPRIFGIGEDPVPPDMRYNLTMDEFIKACAEQREIMLRDQAIMEREEALWEENKSLSG